jgi:hypothetical protein
MRGIDMALQKRPNISALAKKKAEAFIEGAPDTVGRSPKPTRENKQKISVELYPALLADIDALAHQLHMSRAAAISLACADLVEAKLKR